jgi:transketolase
MMKSSEELNNICQQVRRDIVRMVHGAKSGHPGGSLGCVELLVSLYFDVMNHRPVPFDMNGTGQDLFFLSNGHISPLFYSILSRSGYFDTRELKTFRQINSRLQGHPTTHEGLPGVRVASGSLGQGLSVALGAALAKKLNKDDKLVYVLCGDGEIQEGQIWEAAMYAGAKGVDNLIATIDHNGQQIDGSTDQVLPLGDIAAKFKAFGWETHILKNGNDIEETRKVLHEAKQACGKGKPQMIVMHTEMGKGVDFMMGSHKWHGVAPNDEQLQKALEQLPETLGDY